jgi:hypothetical protein
VDEKTIANLTELIELCNEWNSRSEKSSAEYLTWLPEFHETVVEARGGLFAFFYAYCDLDKDNDPANGVYRCLYPLFPIGSGGVALITRDARTLEQEIEKFLDEMRQKNTIPLTPKGSYPLQYFHRVLGNFDEEE